MQTVLVCIVVVLAVAHALWWIVKAVRHAGDPCVGCQGCDLREVSRRTQKKKCAKA